MMKLRGLLEQISCLVAAPKADQEISSLTYDSRRAEPGCLFFAIQGEKADGHRFVGQALERGAVAVVSERPAPGELASRWVQVGAIRRALSESARAFYSHPDSRLKIVGITGTNGKTTTAFLLESILRTAGLPAGLFGTIEYRLPDRSVVAVNTTPESLDLWSYLAELAAGGGKAAVMEVSSHALAQERVWGFPFSAAVFTNLTRDHLDFHKDFEHYFAAKRRLFEGLGTPPPGLAVVNMDDEWGRKLLSLSASTRMTYGVEQGADVRPSRSTLGPSGVRATVETPAGPLEIQSPLVGKTNLLNILAAVSTGVGMGLPRERIAEGIAALASVPGRFERIDCGQPFLVIVDYAHTDDALRNVLRTARELSRNRLLVVFGCGGERDRTKRPLMGEAAGSLADISFLTSDNPRGEDPVGIMNDVLVGLQRTAKPYFAEVDRGAAIRKALAEAREGDVVVLAGKGHETYQILKDRAIPFDERAVARAVLAELGFQTRDRTNGA